MAEASGVAVGFESRCNAVLSKAVVCDESIAIGKYSGNVGGLSKARDLKHGDGRGGRGIADSGGGGCVGGGGCKNDGGTRRRETCFSRGCCGDGHCKNTSVTFKSLAVADLELGSVVGAGGGFEMADKRWQFGFGGAIGAGVSAEVVRGFLTGVGFLAAASMATTSSSTEVERQ